VSEGEPGGMGSAVMGTPEARLRSRSLFDLSELVGD